MARLNSSKRAKLPDSAFAYIDTRGRRRLPIHDEAHVRNALARFNQVRFENDAARERARKRLLNAARKFGIVPVGFIQGQLQAEKTHATVGRLVIELGQHGAPGALEQRLRNIFQDPTLLVLHWSDVSKAYLNGAGKPVPLSGEEGQRVVTYLESQGRPLSALVHDKAILNHPDFTETVLAAVRLVVENDRAYGQLHATATQAAMLPTGFVTFLMTDIEGSTALLRKLGDRYGELLNDVRGVLRSAVAQRRGHEIDARADEFFAVFERAIDAIEAGMAIQRAFMAKDWPEKLDVRIRMGMHSGHPTLTDTGYIGLCVHTAARVSAAAHGGQVVISGETMAALGEATLQAINFRNLGRYHLAGLAEAAALYQMEADGLLTHFPPLRAESVS